jgi:outer membrane protein OmpA-like peptidoglycan-associated protein
MTLPLLLTLAAAPKSAPATSAENELNALSAMVGTRPLNDEGNPTDDAMQLIDGNPELLWEPSREEGVLPSIVLQLPEPFDLTALEVVNSNSEADWPGISTKKMRVELGASASGPWKLLSELSLKKGTAPQNTAIKAPKARYLRVTLLENYGCAEWWSIGELRATGKRVAPRKIDFNGNWETQYGEIVLEQTGERISGCYSTGEKSGLYTVEGAIDGSVFSGIWREQNSQVGFREGTMIFALTAEGELSGVWANEKEGKARDNRWDGERRDEPPTITCEKPEKSIGAQLAKGRVVLRGILFDTGKATIKSESIPVLQELSAAMKKTKASYDIEGHTDDRGGKDYNQKLSEQRAASVKEWLVKAGIPAERLRPVGFGMTRPTMSNETEAGRLQNRRVEVATGK